MQLRLFAALHVEREVAERLADFGVQLLAMPGVTGLVVEPDRMHVTFAFLGDVAEELVPGVAGALEDAAAMVPGPTACAVSGVDAFGDERVLGVEVDLDLLAMLGSARDRFIEAALPYAPAVELRGWRPHVSILRAERGATLAPSLLAEPPQPPAATWIVSGLSLYASLPSPAGRQHRKVLEVPFGVAVSQA